jgi:hypothetical protein
MPPGPLPPPRPRPAPRGRPSPSLSAPPGTQQRKAQLNAADVQAQESSSCLSRQLLGYKTCSTTIAVLCTQERRDACKTSACMTTEPCLTISVHKLVVSLKHVVLVLPGPVLALALGAARGSVLLTCAAQHSRTGENTTDPQTRCLQQTVHARTAAQAYWSGNQSYLSGSPMCVPNQPHRQLIGAGFAARTVCAHCRRQS